MTDKTTASLSTYTPSAILSFTPVILLLSSLIALIALKGADAVQDHSHTLLLASAAAALAISLLTTRRKVRHIWFGIARSAKQILPTIPILAFIGTLAATWMLSGVVPTLIDYGLELLDPRIFLPLACLVCAVVSVVTGSSWTTIATIGVTLMGIGTVMGYSPGWTAGAIISGAYFGDKVSPLSDTTVLASSSCGVPLATHIRFLMLTTLPAMTIALGVYTAVGLTTDTVSTSHASEMSRALTTAFNITPWVLIIPALTCIMIVCRLHTATTLALSSLAGLMGIFVFQPGIAATLQDGVTGLKSLLVASIDVLATETSISTGDELLDSLVSTGGVEGMIPTIRLVISAMIFGGVMIGSGMLGTITRSVTAHLTSPRRLVSATVGSGLFLNGCTGDQYLSIIIGGNVYKSTYRRCGVKPKVLSRSLEDSVSVTSVLIPWNSCGVTQSTVLGVATLVYLPYCIFNLLSPVMSIVMAWTGWRITASRDRCPAHAPCEGVRAS